jgi:hypothetical protein
MKGINYHLPATIEVRTEYTVFKYTPSYSISQNRFNRNVGNLIPIKKHKDVNGRKTILNFIALNNNQESYASIQPPRQREKSPGKRCR